MRKIDLTDVSFLIPVRLDSIVRLENLIAAVTYLSRIFDTKIVVLQADKYENGFLRKLLPKKVEYHFVRDYDDVFYRTMYINMMVRMVDSPIVAVWDADVILPAHQVLEAVEAIRKGGDVSYPYDGHFYDTSPIIRDLYICRREFRLLSKNVSKMNLIYGDDMKGGAFLINREKYIASGLENERIYGWGPEDFERYSRWKTLGYQILRVKGNLYHLTHSRGSNSSYRSLQQMQSSNKEYLKTKFSCKRELLEHLKQNT